MHSVAEFSEERILVIPQALESLRDVTTLFRNDDNGVYFKKLEADLLDIEFYSNRPCFIYIQQGQEVLTKSNNQPLVLNSGEGLLLPQGLRLHSDFVHETSGLEAFLVFFDDQLIAQFLSATEISCAKDDIEDACVISASALLEGYFKHVQMLTETEKTSIALWQTKLLELLHTLYLINPSVAGLLAGQRTLSPKRNLVRLLEDRQILKLSVSDMAALSGRSLASFNRDFKALHQTSPKQWLLNKRMSYARDLLETTDLNVTEVALQVGYENPSHFISAFKARQGLTPNQVRSK